MTEDETLFSHTVTENLPLVRSVAKRFAGRAELDDLIQVGSIGLIKAVRNFDPSRGTELSTYAFSMILGEIRRYLRDSAVIKTGRGVRELSIRIYGIMQNGEEKRISEIAAELGTDPEDVALAMNALRPCVSLNEPAGEDGKELSELIPDVCRTEDTALTKAYVSELLSHLGEKDAELIRLRYLKGLTQAETAAKLIMTQTAVSRAEKRILAALRAAFSGDTDRGTLK